MRLILVLLASIMLASPVYANGGGEDDNTGCNGQGTPNSPCEGGGNGGNGGGGGSGGSGGSGGEGGEGGSGGDGTGVGVGVGVGIGGGATIGDTTATGGSVGDTTATGGEGGTGVGVGIGGDSSATGGNASIYIGGEGEEGEGGALSSNAENNTDVDVDNTNVAGASSTTGDQNTNVTVNVGEDGPLTASSQTVDANASVAEGAVQIDNSNSSVYKEAVRTAATSFSSVCTSGAAAQGNSYGVSIAVTSTQCSYLMQADAYMALGDSELTLKFVNKAARSASIKGFMSNIRTVITLGIL